MPSQRRFSTLAKFALGLVITVLALYFFFKTVSLHDVTATLKGLNPLRLALLLVFTILLTLLSLGLRGLRMAFLLPRQAQASDKGLTGVVSVAFMANNVLPARIGEAVRVFLLYKKNRYSLHASLGLVVVERLIDSFCYGLFILLPGFFYMSSFQATKFLYLIKFILVLVGILGLLALLYFLFPKPLLNFFDALSARLWGPLGRGLKHLLTLVSESTEWMFVWKRFAVVALLTPLTIGCYALMIFLIARFLLIPVQPLQALFSTGVVAMGVALPSSPGYVGTLHLALRESLTVFGVSAAAGTAIAILYHLISWVVTVAAGLIFYFRMNIKFKDMRVTE